MKKLKYILITFLLSFPVVVGAHGDSGLATEGYNSMHFGGGMMGGGGLFPFLMISGYVIWLVIGILLIVWLWKKITNDKK